MNTVAVLEKRGGCVSGLIERKLMSLRGAVQGVSFVGEGCIARGVSPALVVVAPSGPELFKALKPGNCAVLLAPGAEAAMSCPIKGVLVVSYGLSPKDSLTLSSIGNKKMVLTIQRELYTLGGALLERQEIPIDREGQPMEILAATAALLLLGAKPELLMTGTGNHITASF